MRGDGDGDGLGLGDGLGDGSSTQLVKLALGVWPAGHGLQVGVLPLLTVLGPHGLQEGPAAVEDQLP
jgi:hypothetical protein